MTPPRTRALPRAITRRKTPNSLRGASLGDEIIRARPVGAARGVKAVAEQLESADLPDIARRRQQ
jgi:hypothetical protein